MKNNYTVIHLPTTVGGNSSGLSFALKKIGVRSCVISFDQNYINYATDFTIFKKNDGYIKKEVKRFFLLLFVLKYANIIHYNSGTTIATSIPYPLIYVYHKSIKLYILKIIGAFYLNLFELIELNLLKLFNKKIFITFQGDDARQGDYLTKNYNFSIATQVDESYYNRRSDNFKRKKIKRIAKFANKIYALNPDLLNVLPKESEFIPYSHINLLDWPPHFSVVIDRPIRFLHAPSNRAVKGTELIISALDKLKSEGYKFEFILVEGMSNEQAKKIYQSVDVLIDQLFAGWYGGLTVELMSLGKPAIAYIRESDLKLIPQEMADDLPVIRATPSNIFEILKDVLSLSPAEIYKLGLESRAYVEKWHDSLEIARKIDFDYRHSKKFF